MTKTHRHLTKAELHALHRVVERQVAGLVQELVAAQGDDVCPACVARAMAAGLITTMAVETAVACCTDEDPAASMEEFVELLVRQMTDEKERLERDVAKAGLQGVTMTGRVVH